MKLKDHTKIKVAEIITTGKFTQLLMVATDQAETNFLTFPDKFLKFPDFSKSNS